MNIQIRSKEIKINDATKAKIDSEIESFTKFSLNITSVEVFITKVKDTVSVEYNITIAKQSPVIINESDKQLEVAIDRASSRAAEVLGKLHSKVVDHKKSSIKDMEVIDS